MDVPKVLKAERNQLFPDFAKKKTKGFERFREVWGLLK
jgi:hypothetical protein